MNRFTLELRKQNWRRLLRVAECKNSEDIYREKELQKRA